MLVPVLMYGSEAMLRREKERSRVRAVHMDNLRELVGIRRMDRVPNARIRELGVSDEMCQRLCEGCERNEESRKTIKKEEQIVE